MPSSGVRSTTGQQTLPVKLHPLLFFQPTLGRDDPPASLPRGTFGKPDFLDYIEVPFLKLPISLKKRIFDYWSSKRNFRTWMSKKDLPKVLCPYSEDILFLAKQQSYDYIFPLHSFSGCAQSVQISEWQIVLKKKFGGCMNGT